MRDKATRYLLMDNGSLRPQSTLQLRNIAKALSSRVGVQVDPVSLLHSSKIDPQETDGVCAETLVQYIKKHCQKGSKHFVIIPFFFGKSRAFTEYLPERMKFLLEKGFSFTYEIRVEICPLEEENRQLCHILQEHALESKASFIDEKPALVIVDHGTPAYEVHQVRELLTQRLNQMISSEFYSIWQAAMESREGEEYAFNKPLLEDLLENHAVSSPDIPVVIAMLFLLPGRHAGPNGDVAQIASRIQVKHPKFRYKITPLVGEHSLIVDILEKKLSVEKDI